MSRADLFNHAKTVLGLRWDGELAAELGWSKSHLCNVKHGVRKFLEPLKQRVAEQTGIGRDEIESLIKQEEVPYVVDPALPTVPIVRGTLQHEPGMLQGSLSGDRAASPAQTVLPEDPGRAGAGGAAPGHDAGDAGAGTAEAAHQPRRIDLREGGIYYPRDPGYSRSTHRRIVGIVKKDKGTAIVYSTGGNHNAMCNRSTFIRWMQT